MISRSNVFIIAEAGVNHNGDINLAYRLIDIAKEAGVDAIKFQTYKTENLISPFVEMAEYQKKNLGTQETQFEMLKKLELSYEDFKKLQEYCNKKDILFLSTADEEESLDYLVDELKIPLIKIGSSELINLPFLEYVASKKLPVILSTGMANIGEVEIAVNTLTDIYPQIELYLLHCTTDYPVSYDEVNLRAMNTIRNTFNLPVGYSDHTLGIEVPIAATALGARIIEKHFTIDKNMIGPDHSASLNSNELCQMVRTIRNIERAMGDGIKKPNENEIKIKNVVRRTLVASKKCEKGHRLSEQDFELKRAGDGIELKYLQILIGKKMLKDIEKNEIFKWEHILD